MARIKQTALREAFAGMLRHLSLRPTMYTRTGSLGEVAAYVDGYVHGCGYPSGEIGIETGMNPFGRWLADRHGYAENHWANVLLEHFKGDVRCAVEQLSSLYDEYLREK